MAIPTMLSTFLLANKVREVAKSYFQRFDAGEFKNKLLEQESNSHSATEN